MLQETIKNQIKEAMMAKDAIKLSVVRGISAAITNELVAKGKKPQDTLSDEEVLAVISRLAKQRKDSIEQFTSAGRQDLVDEEKAQYAYIEIYLPKLMDKSEVISIAKVKQIELGITDTTKKGLLMSALMKDLKGKADGSVVKEVVDSLFS